MGAGLGSGSAQPLSGPAGVARLGWLSAQRAIASSCAICMRRCWGQGSNTWPKNMYHVFARVQCPAHDSSIVSHFHGPIAGGGLEHLTHDNGSLVPRGLVPSARSAHRGSLYGSLPGAGLEQVTHANGSLRSSGFSAQRAIAPSWATFMGRCLGQGSKEWPRRMGICEGLWVCVCGMGLGL